MKVSDTAEKSPGSGLLGSNLRGGYVEMRDLGVRELDPGLCVWKGVGFGQQVGLSHHAGGVKRRRLKDGRRISKNSP